MSTRLQAQSRFFSDISVKSLQNHPERPGKSRLARCPDRGFSFDSTRKKPPYQSARRRIITHAALQIIGHRFIARDQP